MVWKAVKITIAASDDISNRKVPQKESRLNLSKDTEAAMYLTKTIILQPEEAFKIAQAWIFLGSTEEAGILISLSTMNNIKLQFSHFNASTQAGKNLLFIFPND